MKLLITGGTGFLGRRCAAWLEKQGFEVNGCRHESAVLLLLEIAAGGKPVQGRKDRQSKGQHMKNVQGQEDPRLDP